MACIVRRYICLLFKDTLPTILKNNVLYLVTSNWSRLNKHWNPFGPLKISRIMVNPSGICSSSS